MKTELIKKGLGAFKLKAAPVIFWCRKHAPEILVATGAVSVGGGTVLACHATLKAKDILEEEVVTEIEVIEDGEPVVYDLTENEIRKAQIKKGARVAVSYLPAAGLVIGGVSMMIGAKSIEHRRLTAALGAYASLQATFEQYRERIVAEHGAAADLKALTGKTVENGFIFSEPEEGKKPKKEKVELVIREDEDPFHRIFDDCNCPHSWRSNLEENRFFLECQQRALNDRLKYTGRVFLNDVYDALGFSYLPIGQFVGWVADDIEGAKDGYIDFGIDYAYLRSEIARAQAEGRNPEPSIWLNFNCDGEVWSNPMRKRYDS